MSEDTEVPTDDRPLAGYATFERRRLVLSEAGVVLVRKKTLSPSTAAVNETNASCPACGVRGIS